MNVRELQAKYKQLEKKLADLNYQIAAKEDQKRQNTIELKNFNNRIEPQVIEVTRRATELSQLDMTPKVFFDEYQYLILKIRELRGS